MNVESALNIMDLKNLAQQNLPPEAYQYLVGGADDLRTVSRNRTAFSKYSIRPRRLVDVSRIDTTVELFGTTWNSPIVIAPLGLQGLFHAQREIPTAKAAANKGHLMIASTISHEPFHRIAEANGQHPWLQLYPTTDRSITERLIRDAEKAGAGAIALTVDVPVPGNRESHTEVFLGSVNESLGNLQGLSDSHTFFDPSLDWDFVTWLKNKTPLNVLIKGIMTEEDTLLALKHQANGVIVSNHGGRQLESDLSTIECLEEVVSASEGTIPVLLDGGVRRGTDVFKALALGARAVCIGRAFCYGLAAGGQAGVEKALAILQSELIRDMQIAGAVGCKHITRDYLT